MSQARPLALLCILWLAAVIAVDPRGGFAITDDWAYAESVRALLAGEGVKFSDWAAANLISQVFWGAGFAALFGLSPTVLRVSTLVAALIGAVALYRLFRLARVEPGLALIGTLAGVFNPLYFSLAFSFMTDVPYTAMQLAAMWLLAGGMIFRSRLRQGLGWALALAALLCRQIGIFVPVGLAGEAMLRRPLAWRRVLLTLLPILVFALVQWGYQHWLQVTGKAPALYGRQITGIAGGLTENPKATLIEAARLPLFCFYYLGLFALPLTVPCVPAWRAMLPERWRAWAIPVVAVTSLLVFGLSLAMGWVFPMWRDTVNAYNGLGPERMGAPLPVYGDMILTGLAAVGGVLLAAALAGAAESWRRSRGDRFDVPVFAALTGLAVLAPVALIAMRFDRYLIPVLPCVLLALAALLAEHRPGRASLLAGFGVAGVMGLVSIAATHDYLEAKRVHWRVYTELVKTQPPTRVDAGWVTNGAMSFGKVGTTADLMSWVESADHVVGTELRPGYDVISRHPVARWSPWNQDGAPILVMRRRP